MNTLSVSYVPQLGIEADEHNNDCGASSSLMLLRSYSLAKEVTVDQIYNLIKPSGDSALSAGELQVRMASDLELQKCNYWNFSCNIWIKNLKIPTRWKTCQFN